MTRNVPTVAVRFLSRLVLAVLITEVLPLGTRAADAAATPEQACQNGRYAAAAKYSACEQKAMGKFQASFDYTKFNGTASKCRVKYTGTWAKLQAKASGTGASCDNSRFDTTTTLGTVIDRLTGLQWEQKTDDASVHDKDNLYSWTTLPFPMGTAADGTAYTNFLTTLTGFAGQHDWRLPTRAELQTILSEPYPCTTSPCIDQGVFGPTVAAYYWSATTYSATAPSSAWVVDFGDGFVIFNEKDEIWSVRAVRGGL
jgi:hypothetical protein